MNNFWISFCGDFTEGYKSDFNISKNKPDFYEGYINTHVYTSDFVEKLEAENARYREALLKIKIMTDDPNSILYYVAKEALKGE